MNSFQFGVTLFGSDLVMNIRGLDEADARRKAEALAASVESRMARSDGLLQSRALSHAVFAVQD